MSSKVIKKTACIFTYGVNAAKSLLINNLCNSQGIEYRQIKEEDRFQKIGWIAGYPGYSKVSAEFLPKQGQELSGQSKEQIKKPVEVMIFSALPDEKLDAFLDAYKTMGIEPVGLKAIVTRHNENWTLDELVLELIRERTAIFLEQMKKKK